MWRAVAYALAAVSRVCKPRQQPERLSGRLTKLSAQQLSSFCAIGRFCKEVRELCECTKIFTFCILHALQVQQLPSRSQKPTAAVRLVTFQAATMIQASHQALPQKSSSRKGGITSGSMQKQQPPAKPAKSRRKANTSTNMARNTRGDAKTDDTWGSSGTAHHLLS